MATCSVTAYKYIEEVPHVEFASFYIPAQKTAGVIAAFFGLTDKDRQLILHLCANPRYNSFELKDKTFVYRFQLSGARPLIEPKLLNTLPPGSLLVTRQPDSCTLETTYLELIKTKVQRLFSKSNFQSMTQKTPAGFTKKTERITSKL